MQPMGRRPSVHQNMPPRMRPRQKPGGIYYYYDLGGKPRREIPLGNDYATAVRKWVELEQDTTQQAASLLTFKAVADRYLKEVLPTKAARTQKDNLTELANLLKFFNNPPAPLESIKPMHIRLYLDWRGQQARTRANREKALFSHIWNMARAWGLTELANPCIGIKGFGEDPRDVYIEDDVYQAVYGCADRALKDAMDLEYLCAQRPADTLKLSETNIQDGQLVIAQNKTDARLRINIKGKLKKVIKRIMETKRGHKVRSLALICKDNGAALSYGALRDRFDRARAMAAKKHPKLAEAIREFQFRDLRAKGGTDKAEAEGNVRSAQKLFGHSMEKTTEIYIRNRRGDSVDPVE